MDKDIRRSMSKDLEEEFEIDLDLEDKIKEWDDIQED